MSIQIARHILQSSVTVMGNEVSSLQVSGDLISKTQVKVGPRPSKLTTVAVPHFLHTSASANDVKGKLKRRLSSKDSMEDQNWGLFVDFDHAPDEFHATEQEGGRRLCADVPLRRSLSLPTPAASPPMYVLESNLDTQHLWYITAGQRPKQPEHERKYFERLWLKNFEASSVTYSESEKVKLLEGVSGHADGEVQPSVRSGAVTNDGIPTNRDKIPVKEFDCKVVFRGRGPFSKSVSKSFVGHELATLTLQVRLMN